MSTIQVSSERSNGTAATASYEMPDDIQGMTEKFSAEIVYSHVRRSLIIALQAFMRSNLDSGKSQEEIQNAVTEWKPGARKPAKSPLERAREELARMSPADRAALAKEIKAARQETTA